MLQPHIFGIGPDIRIRPVRQRVDPPLVVLIAGLEYPSLFTVVKRHDDAVTALFVRYDLQLVALFPPSHALILAHTQRQDRPALLRHRTLFQMFAAVSHLAQRRDLLYAHQFPHTIPVHHVIGQIPQIAVFLEICTLEIDKLRRIDACNTMHIKMPHSGPAHQMPQHAAVFLMENFP